MAQMLGQYPQRLLLIGVQPEELDDYGGSLRPAVKAQIQPAVDIALTYLAGFAVAPEMIADVADITDPALDIQRYEQERPSSEQACRSGDQRILQSAAFQVRPPRPLDWESVGIDVDYRGKY